MTPDRTVELAVAQALEMAAKVCEENARRIIAASSYGPVGWAVSKANSEDAKSIRALIPAGFAAAVQKAREDTELLDWMESHPWEAYCAIEAAYYTPEKGNNLNYREVVAAARGAK